MAVGTSTGQVLLYDLRSNKPLLVRDHFYNLPIKSLNFHDQLDLVVSADSKIIKIWNKDTGKAFSSIQPQTNINDVCIYPNSGMLFTANEDPKMNTFYVPVSAETFTLLTADFTSCTRPVTFTSCPPVACADTHTLYGAVKDICRPR
ncbi:nucleolar protein 10-like [Anarrhichthys ocellatus]|uniref:nucleolar protein 10-like n=1 Tax=Anarrhichthys ocellatus TaxID=433405 RepID=UPI0012EE2BAF|nr:nucleolar protein 10-like [Anarrhichthys ocellatus]XP_031697484.1 nucleolar protein 10-like [Anarrhichthys ocellatus]